MAPLLQEGAAEGMPSQLQALARFAVLCPAPAHHCHIPTWLHHPSGLPEGIDWISRVLERVKPGDHIKRGICVRNSSISP